MKINALLRTSNYRGDHAADVAIALDVTAEMTVGELMAKMGKDESQKFVDWIELRITPEAQE